PGYLDDLCDGRCACRGRGPDGDALLRRRRFLHRISGRCEGVYRCCPRRHWIVAGRDAGRHPDWPHRGLLVRLFFGRVQRRLGLCRPRAGAGVLPDRAAWPAGGGEGLMTAASGLAVDTAAPPSIIWPALLKDALLAAFVAVLLAVPLVGLQTYDVGGGALG